MKKIFLLSNIFLFIFCNNQKEKINPEIEIYDNSIESIIDVYSEFEIIADSISLPEGPVWDNNSNSLFFVDNINDKILKWNEEKGVEDFKKPGGNTGYSPNLGEGLLGPNGMIYDSENNLLLVCQHGDRRIASLSNENGQKSDFKTVVDNYDGMKLNSPNDLVMSKNGTIYFTDPPFAFFNLETFEFIDSELRELDFNGVFKYDPKINQTSIISKDIDAPNGLGLSSDEKFLYVNKMGRPFSKTNSKIIKINLSNLSSETIFEGKNLFQKYNDGSDFDGMAVHSSGNIFTSGPGGLLVISSEGKLLAKMNLKHITNCTFDYQEKYLYVTGFLDNPKVYRIKLKI
ncbi:MAG: hypothetical protein CMC67_03940 [Flavobacteriaceae bacterium]|nr:hypothetical protein [Flavobacteriaceae bacterium]|tara:strand:+ start:340 stop:1371 length:1032 start_codon:yes stop_codon:yes gene_type:complete